MSEYEDRIGGWIAFALFFLWVIVGPHVQIPTAQVAPPLQALTAAPWAPPNWLWPGFAPLVAAAIAGGFAFKVAQVYTGRVKRFDATLEFSKRFHDLIQRQRELNAEYETALAEKGAAKRIDRELIKKIGVEDATAWWWRFFDLVLHEFDFWQQGYVRDQRFMEWMIWRWYDSHPRVDAAEPRWATCGMDYMQGWEIWRSHPAHGNRLKDVLKAVHEADHPNMVPDKIDRYRGITAPARYRGAKGLNIDVRRDQIKVDDGEYLDLARGLKLTFKDNKLIDKTTL